MALTESELRPKLRRTYELGRLRGTLRDSWVVVPIALLGLIHHRLSLLAIGCGVGLLAVITLLSWRGQVWRRALWPGVLIGAAPLMLPALAPRDGFCMIGGTCLSACLLLCPLGGLIAGWALGRAALAQPTQRVHFLVAAGAVTALMGAYGCVLAGAAGLVGMVIGGTLGLAPTYRRWARS